MEVQDERYRLGAVIGPGNMQDEAAICGAHHQRLGRIANRQRFGWRTGDGLRALVNGGAAVRADLARDGVDIGTCATRAPDHGTKQAEQAQS